MNPTSKFHYSTACPYCGAQHGIQNHTYDCPLEQIPLIFNDGRQISDETRKSLANLNDALTEFLADKRTANPQAYQSLINCLHDAVENT